MWSDPDLEGFRERLAGAHERIEKWTYDADGRLLEHRERDQAGGLTNLEEYAYQVDAEGNWVHRTTTRRHLPHSTEEMISTTEPVIEYDDDRIAETGGGAGSIPTVLPRSNG